MEATLATWGEDYIEAYVPVTLLGQLSEQPGVTRVREIVPPQPVETFQSIIGHGPAVHGSPAWNQAGYSGQGVKVGVIDVGFAGLTSLMGTELPATVHARCYTDVGKHTANLADCEAPDPVPDSTIPECRDAVQPEASDHGTIVAESVLDIAPGVELYVSQPGSRADLQEAAEWMASEGVSVINYSVGWFFDGPGDGTSPPPSSRHPPEYRGPVGGKRSHLGQLSGEFRPEGLVRRLLQPGRRWASLVRRPERRSYETLPIRACRTYTGPVAVGRYLGRSKHGPEPLPGQPIYRRNLCC